jgi:hypothetical protein
VDDLSENNIPKRRKLYEAAVLETEPALLKKRAIEAENSVLLRMEELEGSADHHDEREALTRTVTALQVCATQTGQSNVRSASLVSCRAPGFALDVTRSPATLFDSAHFVGGRKTTRAISRRRWSTWASCVSARAIRRAKSIPCSRVSVGATAARAVHRVRFP